MRKIIYRCDERDPDDEEDINEVCVFCIMECKKSSSEIVSCSPTYEPYWW